MTQLTHYSLWFMPSDKINAVLSQTISQLSRQFKTPVFPPHITLLGDLIGDEKEFAAKTMQLAARIQPFEVALTTIDSLDEYYRCLFLQVEETPVLLEAGREARILFQREKDPEYMPHLSLMYGNLDPEIKKKIIRSIRTEFNQPFSVSQVHLVSTTGEPKDWYCVQEYDF